MFALIRFCGGSFDVCRSKNIITQNNTCTVRCSGGRYEAAVLTCNDDKDQLLSIKQKLNAHSFGHDEENEIQEFVSRCLVQYKTDISDNNNNDLNPNAANATSEYSSKDAQTRETELTQQDCTPGSSQILTVQSNDSNPNAANATSEYRSKDAQTHETVDIQQDHTPGSSQILTVQSNDSNPNAANVTSEYRSKDAQTHETVDIQQDIQQDHTPGSSQILTVQSNDSNPNSANATSEDSSKDVQTHETELTQQDRTPGSSEILTVQSIDSNPNAANSTSEHEGEDAQTCGTKLKEKDWIPGTREILTAEIICMNSDWTRDTSEIRAGNNETDLSLHRLESELSGTEIISNSYSLSESSIIVPNHDDPIWAQFEKSTDCGLMGSMPQTDEPVSEENTNKSLEERSEVSAHSSLRSPMLQKRKVSFPSANTTIIPETESDNDDGSDYNPEDDHSQADASDETDIDDEDNEAEICSPDKSATLNGSRNRSAGSCNLSSTSVSNVAGTSACDDENMIVQPPNGPQGIGKVYCCFYCHKKVTKIARHLERVHKTEEDVKKFLVLPKKSAERIDLIKNLRNKGNFLHNKDADLNNGELIVCRRPQKKMKKDARDFVPCPKCRGFFAKSNVRHHFQHCVGGRRGNSRSILVSGRKILGRINSAASLKLRNRIIPVMREDNIVRLIRYDRLLVLYGNKMCRKCTSQHQHDGIRAHLRLLGRFFADIKTIKPEITDFASLYDPKFYDAVIASINNIAQLDEEIETYRHPSLASTIGTCIKKIGAILETECIKQHDMEKKINTGDFLKLFIEDFGCSVGKTVVESQAKHQRQKKVELPVTEDIVKLNGYLNEKREAALRSLNKKFTFEAWLSLAQVTLILVQVFNRRRAGELERVEINDFNNYVGASDMDKDLFASLSSENQEAAKKYVRFTIRGKLNRTVPVLLSQELLESVKAIIKFRNAAKVPDKNPYIFGLPNGDDKSRHLYLRACNLMRKFSEECSANNPKTLRGTILRKHVATKCVTMDLPENEISDVANFMGHHEKIHKNIYRQPVASRDIVRMSQVLERAVGTSHAAAGGDSSNSNAEIPLNGPEKICIQNKAKDRKRKTERRMNDELHDDMGDFRDDDEHEHFSNADSDCSDMEGDVEELLGGSNKRTKKQSSNQKPKKRRSTSPYGKTKRKRWSANEVEAALTLFRESIQKSIIPSLPLIEKKIAKIEALNSRNSVTVKAWINNQIKKQEKLELRKSNNKHLSSQRKI